MSGGKEEMKISSGTFVQEQTGTIKDKYKITSCIGRGAYGEVRKCYNRDTGSLRAVKIINKKYLEDDEK
jgi:serine/threonine protein kinase